jgi:catechol 2,3-dioxygenase-like lactoylglutathione lyase family enzyme
VRSRLHQVVVDCRRPAVLARFWADLLGGEPVDREDGWSHVEPPGFVRLAFLPVAEREELEDRLHLDIEVDDVQEEVARAERAGGRRVGGLVVDEQGSFHVVHDPEGVEFCFVRPFGVGPTAHG